MTLNPTIYNADTLAIRPILIGPSHHHGPNLRTPNSKAKLPILDISSIGDHGQMAHGRGTMAGI